MKEITSQNFHSEILDNPASVVLMFHAFWCPKCTMMMPTIEELEKKYSRQIQFFTIDMDKEPRLAQKYNADIIPTFVFFRNGKTLNTLQGMTSEATFENYLKKIFINC